MSLSIAAGLGYLTLTKIGSTLWDGAMYLATWHPLSPKSNKRLFGACQLLQFLLFSQLVAWIIIPINAYLAYVFPLAVNLALSVFYGLSPLLALLPWRGAKPSPISARRIS